MASGGVLRRAAQRLLRDPSTRVNAGQPIPATHPQVCCACSWARFGRAAASGFRIHLGQPQSTPVTACVVQLLEANELMPGIASSEFAQRRTSLAALLPPNSFAVLPAAPMQYMAGVIPYPYRQEADFAYLTGVQQSNAVAVVESSCRGRPASTLAA